MGKKKKGKTTIVDQRVVSSEMARRMGAACGKSNANYLLAMFSSEELRRGGLRRVDT